MTAPETPTPSPFTAPPLDLRQLPPPGPMLEVLRRIETGQGGARFSILVPHVPVPLFPELTARGWRWSILSDDASGAIILLEKDPAP